VVYIPNLSLSNRYWLLAAVVIGLGARLIMLSAHSLLFDEAFVAIGARDMLHNHTPMWDAISNAPFVWLIAHILGSAGIEHPFLLRLPAALIGTATIIPVYFLARRLFDDSVAALAALFFALHPFSVAFSRVLFADPFQVFFILTGLLAFDYYATRPRRSHSGGMLALIVLIWATAFLMKYNAVVPGAIWLVAGTLAGRYYFRPALVCFIAMTLGALFALALWPYDAPIWLAAFLEKGGSYDLRFSTYYFESKLHLVLYDLTEATLIGGLLLGYFKRGRYSSSFALTSLFLLLYLAIVILLGRTFQRYLLVTVPASCILIAALLRYCIATVREASLRWQRIGASILWPAALTLLILGAASSYRNYIAYLDNDIDQAALVHDAKILEHQGRMGFWLTTEPVAAYYLGYTRYYSRSTLGETYYSDSLPPNYFESQPVSYEWERAPYGVLAVRGLLRSWGYSHAIQMSSDFFDSAHYVARAAHDMPKKPAVDYLTSNLVKPGSLLVIESGFRDIQGEPILEDIRKEEGPPPEAIALPLRNFELYRTYRPGGYSTLNDTIISSVKAGGWILIKK
jgi:4-amino-4-deoxy-L-arabinose transferase-like glycosyltransferase